MFVNVIVFLFVYFYKGENHILVSTFSLDFYFGPYLLFSPLLLLILKKHISFLPLSLH